MADDMGYPLESVSGANGLNRRRRVAWILILIVDVSCTA